MIVFKRRIAVECQEVLSLINGNSPAVIAGPIGIKCGLAIKCQRSKINGSDAASICRTPVVGKRYARRSAVNTDVCSSPIDIKDRAAESRMAKTAEC